MAKKFSTKGQHVKNNNVNGSGFDDPRWGILQKTRFLASYFTAKLLIPFEVSNERSRLWRYEWREFFKKVETIAFNRPKNWGGWSGGPLLHTKFGDFFIRPGTHDVTVVSPAFERLDMNRLLSNIQRELVSGREVVFIDGGANIGRYTVAVMNRFSKNKVRAFAFEPDAGNLVLLRKNVDHAAKHTATAQIFPHGLSDKNGTQSIQKNSLRPYDQGLSVTAGDETSLIELKKLDEVMPPSKPNETVVIKLDVEGHEISVLNGARKYLLSSKRVIFLIEDVIRRETVYAYLHEMGARPIEKRTQYNSWWILES